MGAQAMSFDAELVETRVRIRARAMRERNALAAALLAATRELRNVFTH
jgi:hypothetical protein